MILKDQEQSRVCVCVHIVYNLNGEGLRSSNIMELCHKTREETRATLWAALRPKVHPSLTIPARPRGLTAASRTHRDMQRRGKVARARANNEECA